MAQVGNNTSRFGGEFMVQDSDHMSEVSQAANSAQHSDARQPEQSQSRDRQQGTVDQNVSGQQGGERTRKSR